MADYKVAILGAGFGGLGMAARLKERGEDSFVILEKADRIGGTWRDNTYPGSGCDVPSHLYSYSFETNPGWTRKYSLQPEIQAYMERVAGKRGLGPHIRFHAEVESARWDDADGLWRIALAGGETLTAENFVAAWGQLNRPAWPTIEGAGDFGGPSFHSARWDHSVDLAGKRVAVIGCGASALQFIPRIAPEVGTLTVFQRTPNWVVPRGDRGYHPLERLLFKVAPWVLGGSRAFKSWIKEYGWKAFEPGSKMSEKFRQGALAYLEAHVKDPVLRAKLTPDYPIGCKRILVADDFYQALVRPNVEVVADPIAHIEADAVVTADGTRREADVLIYATGFETNSFMGVHEVTGRNGLTLSEAWADGAHAYLGVTVAGFPNFFMLYGPNTNLGHNSIIFMLERQIDYVLQAMALVKAKGARALDVRADAMARFNEELQRDLKGTAFAAGCASWYKTADGRITNNGSGPTTAYRRATARVNLDDYALIPL